MRRDNRHFSHFNHYAHAPNHRGHDHSAGGPVEIDHGQIDDRDVDRDDVDRIDIPILGGAGPIAAVLVMALFALLALQLGGSR